VQQVLATPTAEERHYTLLADQAARARNVQAAIDLYAATPRDPQTHDLADKLVATWEV
jgi:hypothetical protein